MRIYSHKTQHTASSLLGVTARGAVCALAHTCHASPKRKPRATPSARARHACSTASLDRGMTSHSQPSLTRSTLHRSHTHTHKRLRPRVLAASRAAGVPLPFPDGQQLQPHHHARRRAHPHGGWRSPAAVPAGSFAMPPAHAGRGWSHLRGPCSARPAYPRRCLPSLASCRSLSSSWRPTCRLRPRSSARR